MKNPGGPLPDMDKLLAEIEEALPLVTWRESTVPSGDHDCRAHEGDSVDRVWHFVVIDFDIEYQGFPPGSRGWDGVARKGFTIVHLPRPLAERAFKLALTATRKRDTNDA